MLLIRCTSPSDKVSSDVMVPKSFDRLVLEGRVSRSKFFTWMAKKIIFKLLAYNIAEGLQDELRKGHSFFAEGHIKPIMKGIKNEYMPGKLVAVKFGGLEHRFSVEVFGKHDEKHMPQEAVAASVAGGGGIEE